MRRPLHGRLPALLALAVALPVLADTPLPTLPVLQALPAPAAYGGCGLGETQAGDLLATLHHGDRTARRNAADTLAGACLRCRPQVEYALVHTALNDPCPAARLAAVNALDTLGATGPVTRQAFAAAAAGDRSPRVRGAAKAWLRDGAYLTEAEKAALCVPRRTGITGNDALPVFESGHDRYEPVVGDIRFVEQYGWSGKDLPGADNGIGQLLPVIPPRTRRGYFILPRR